MTKISIFAALFMLAAGINASAVGVTIRGGGDEVGLDFQSSLLQAIDIAKNQPEISGLIPFKQLDALSLEVVTVDHDIVIEASPGVFQNSIASNSRDTNTIEINRVRWQNLREVSIKQGIALHEVLSLVGIEKTGVYTISSQYVAKFGVSLSRFLVSINSQEQSPLLDSYEPSSISVICTQNCNTGNSYPNSYQVSLDGTRILESKFISRDRSQWRLFNLLGKKILEFEGASFQIWNVFLDNGSFFGASAKDLNIYDRNGVIIDTLVGVNPTDVQLIQFLPRHNRVFINLKNSWQLWDLTTGKAKLLFSSPFKIVAVLDIDKNTENFITRERRLNGAQTTLRNKDGISLASFNDGTFSLGFANSGGRSYYQNFATGQVTVLDVDGNALPSPNFKPNWINQILFPSSSDSWITFDKSGTLLWSADNVLLKRFPQLSQVFDGMLSPNGNLLVNTVSKNYDLSVFDLNSATAYPLLLKSPYQTLAQFAVDKYIFNDSVLSAHNFIGNASALFLWDTKGKLLRSFYEGRDHVDILKIDYANRRFLTKIGNNRLTVWSLDANSPLFEFTTEMKQIVSVKFTARGLMVVTSDTYNTVQVERWEPTP